MLSFSRDPKGYVQDLLRSQSRDLKVKRETQGVLEWKTSTSGKTVNVVLQGQVRGFGAQGSPHAPSQVMTDVAGNPEEERRAEFYHQPWSQEAVSRYFYCKVWRDPCPKASPSSTPRETSLFSLWAALTAPHSKASPYRLTMQWPSLLPDALPWQAVSVGGGCPDHSPGTLTPAPVLTSSKDPAAQAGAGAVAGCAQHLGAQK